MKKSINYTIPRAFLYMHLMEPIISILKWPFFGGKVGETTFKFEQKLSEKFNLDNILCVSHARIALYYILKSLKFNDGDEVLMTSVNLPDMVNVIESLHLVPKFIDFDNNYNIALDAILPLISDRTKVLFIAPLNGIVPDLRTLKDIALKHNLILVLDGTQVLGGYHEKLAINNYADFSFWSFCNFKEIHTHLGAMLTSKDSQSHFKIKEIYESESKPLKLSYFLKYLIEDFFTGLILNRFIFNFLISHFMKRYQLTKKEYKQEKGSSAFSTFGVSILKVIFGGTSIIKGKISDHLKFKYCDILAELGLKRLELHDEIISKRKNNSKLLLRNLSSKTRKNMPLLKNQESHTYWRIPIYLEDIKSFQKYMLENNIDVAPSNLRCLNPEKSNISRIQQNSVCLPNYYYLTEQEILSVAGIVNSYFV